MNNLGVRKDPMKTRRRGVLWDSRRRGLNPQYLRTMKNILEGSFLLEVYIRNFFPLKVEINLLR
jgi:hypothetical protein